MLCWISSVMSAVGFRSGSLILARIFQSPMRMATLGFDWAKLNCQ